MNIIKNLFKCARCNTTNNIVYEENPMKKENKELPLEINIKKLKPFIPDVKEGRVVKVYDGDTITLAISPNNTICTDDDYEYNNVYKFSVRILGIDTPEIKPKKPKKTDDMDLWDSYQAEKEAAQIARDKLALLIFSNIVQLENVSYDKYGRLLCNVKYNGIDVAEYLIEKRLGVTYDGGTKKCPSNWMEYYTKGEM